MLRDNEAQKAIMVSDGITHDLWIPRSQIKSRTENENGTEDIRVPMWIAVEKGIEFDEGTTEDEAPFK